MVKAVQRAWIPLVIIVVVTIAVFSVYRLHGVFGKTLKDEKSSDGVDAQNFCLVKSA